MKVLEPCVVKQLLFTLDAKLQYDHLWKPFLHLKVLNLERRRDRRLRVLETLKGLQPEIVPAVNGLGLKQATESLRALFSNNHFKNRTAVMACALSHVQIWKQLIEDKPTDFYVVMEDDVQLSSNFHKLLPALLPECAQRPIVFFGYSMWPKKLQDTFKLYREFDVNPPQVTLEPVDSELFVGGAFAYSINKLGATRLLEYIQHEGIKYPIDRIMGNVHAHLCSECRPHLVLTDSALSTRERIDSDIQYSRQTLSL